MKEISDQTKMIIASNLTVAYCMLKSQGLLQGKSKSEKNKLIREEVIKIFNGFNRALTSTKS